MRYELSDEAKELARNLAEIWENDANEMLYKFTQILGTQMYGQGFFQSQFSTRRIDHVTRGILTNGAN
jgi:hypothetical protein